MSSLKNSSNIPCCTDKSCSSPVFPPEGLYIAGIKLRKASLSRCAFDHTKHYNYKHNLLSEVGTAACILQSVGSRVRNNVPSTMLYIDRAIHRWRAHLPVSKKISRATLSLNFPQEGAGGGGLPALRKIRGQLELLPSRNAVMS